MRIMGAPGKRPILRNVSREMVEHFRRTVEVIDLVGETDRGRIFDATKACAARNPGLPNHCRTRTVAAIAGYITAAAWLSTRLEYLLSISQSHTPIAHAGTTITTMVCSIS